MTEELKPCPFCGGKAILIYPSNRKMVKCTQCGCTTSAMEQYPAKRWNERVNDGR